MTAPDATPTDPAGPPARRSRLSHAFELPVMVTVALVTTLVVKAFVVQMFYIPSGSMEPLLHGCAGCQGDRVAVNLLAYRNSDIERGQIVVFAGPNTWPNRSPAVRRPDNPVLRALRQVAVTAGFASNGKTDYVKRVIGLPGDRVECCDEQGRVTVNGVPLDEPYVLNDNRTPFGPLTVPEGELWVLGDHRGVSADSRSYGPVPIANVIGRAQYTIWPLSRWRKLPAQNPLEPA